MLRARHYQLRNGAKAKWRIAKSTHICNAQNNGYQCFTRIEPGTRYFDSGEPQPYPVMSTRKFCEACGNREI
jgi:hypothetical protein